MASLKELRIRINSVKTTRQITSAMKMVAAAKLRKAQQAILQLRPYAEEIHGLLSDVVSFSFEDIENDFFTERPVKNVLLVVITSNRGLCGAFNSNVEKKAVAIAEEYKNSGIQNIDIYAFGKRGAEGMQRRGFKVIKQNFEIFDNLTYENVSEITKEIEELYSSGKYDKIEIVYNSFKNAATQILTSEQFLPVAKVEKKGKITGDFAYEPDFQTVLSRLVPEALTMQIFKALQDSYASEHGARMTAMHKATDNATELIHDLTLVYNKARQAAITKEIIEIVSGAEALNG